MLLKNLSELLKGVVTHINDQLVPGIVELHLMAAEANQKLIKAVSISPAEAVIGMKQAAELRSTVAPVAASVCAKPP